MYFLKLGTVESITRWITKNGETRGKARNLENLPEIRGGY